MAHIFSLFPDAGTGYKDGRKDEGQVKFPDTPYFKGALKPSRLEGDITELETSGNIPPEINGTFFRVQPDPQFPPVFEDDVHFSGDGNVSAFRFNGGHVDWKQRYVRTDRFEAERSARKAMFGKYRNTFTDNEAVKGIIRTVSNTNVIFWRGSLLALKEDGPPFAMDPTTLETLGRYDFEGQLESPTFAAHPKFDPQTGEMVAFAYAASGDGQDANCDLAVWTFDRTGKKTQEAVYKAPFCGMIHDAALTSNYLILPLTPLKASLARLKAGGNHWAWDPDEDQWYGIVPRRGGKDIIWLRSDNAFHGHVTGAYENEDGHIVCDLTVAYGGNVFFWWPPEGSPSTGNVRQKLSSDTVRWIFDPNSPSGTRVEPAKRYGTNGEFSRVDDRWVTRKYRHFWQLQIDPSRPYNIAKCGPPAGGLFNVIGHFDWETGSKNDVFWAGDTTTFQEPVFVPKSGAEGDGYLMTLLNHLDVLRNDILIFDALNVAKGPIGACHLPVQIRLGLHGNFVEQREIDEWEQRRREGGEAVKVATKPLPWQQKLLENGAAQGANGGR
ncbi:carotenoid oxygenase [Gaeumannomyces tritici R3-111a-1]|uniref:Carotenoid oxygenase n=1 Tax=Gaeumannomyces tritici (strain R3-111a-1) TaxID=644352 RepID=J3NTE2_GAET3|nr:carotenoid oxygenase [Gaeumannomyces tritici R3-111a-1]EJT79457.1 carotenoid oxygenase [Gaeumannomyces tritici R3-111a-1]